MATPQLVYFLASHSAGTTSLLYFPPVVEMDLGLGKRESRGEVVKVSPKMLWKACKNIYSNILLVKVLYQN